VESKVGKGSTFTFTLPKISTEALFREYLNRAVKIGTPFSLIVVRIVDFKKVEMKIGPSKSEELLKDIEDRLKSILHRNDRIVSRCGNGDVVAILNVAGKEEALIVEERIRGILKRYKISYDDKKRSIRFIFGNLTYPEDVSNEDVIINKLSEELSINWLK